jgi:hypothetical protein
MKNTYIRGISFSVLYPVLCLGAVLFAGCATSPAAENSNVSLDRAIQIAVENIEQGMGPGLDAAAFAGSAEREMQGGDMDPDAVRRRALDFVKKPVTRF